MNYPDELISMLIELTFQILIRIQNNKKKRFFEDDVIGLIKWVGKLKNVNGFKDANPKKIAQVYHNIARCSLSLKMYETALVNNERARQLDSSNLEAKYLIVQLLLDLGKKHEAFQRFLKIKEDHVDIASTDSYWFGIYLEKFGQYEDAIKIFSRISNNDENFYNSKYHMANSIAQIGRELESNGNYSNACIKFYESIKLFKNLYENSPEKNQILLNISDVYKYLKKYDSALEYIDIYKNKSKNAELSDFKKNQIWQLQKSISYSN